jgi:NADH dehydrogenase/NADH:ubiquinone oxidoreductase subunit G
MKLTIDGREVLGRDGATILEVARGAGVPIPSLCDHPGLEPFAGCRICLVEIEGRKDLAPACATPAGEGQVVRTRTPAIVALRKEILELILAEHPYACLVCPEKMTCDDLKSTIRKTGEVTGCVLCPQNGRCRLQDVAAEVGLGRVVLPAAYRNLEVDRRDPFFDRDYNLCILCGRCIRVCEDVRGAAVLSFAHRGSRTLVGTAFDRPLLESGCRFCGACVDVCPTGALVERAFRPQAAATRTATIVCPFCAQGCVLALRIRNDEVMDGRPVDRAPNHGQACVKGRFLVRSAVAGPGRIVEAHVRKDGRLEPVPLEEALDRAAAGLRSAADGRRALVFPSQVPLEDALAFLAFGRDTLEAGAVAASPAPLLEAALDAFTGRHGLVIPAAGEFSAIEGAGTIVAWDIDLPGDHPIAWLQVVRAVRRGAGFVAAGRAPAGPAGRRAAIIGLSSGTPLAAAGLASALLAIRPAPPAELEGAEAFHRALPAAAAPARARREFEDAARIIGSGGPAVILFDAAAVVGVSGGEALDWLWNLAQAAGARLVPLARLANELGVHALIRAFGPPAAATGLPELWAGLEARAFEALYLAGPLPDLGEHKPPFLVCQDTHWSPNAELADVVLPAAAFAESGGIWINAEGRSRVTEAALPLRGSGRPDREILAALAERLGHPGPAGPDAAAAVRDLIGLDPAVKPAWLQSPPAGPLRFVPVRAPAAPHGRRPAAKTAAAGPDLPGETLRGFDLVAGNRGYARTRRAR